jgi:Fe-S cluster assembly iron-binding protein IscA
MLEVSDAAAEAILELAEAGGLRLVAVGSGKDVELELSVADEPEDGDEVVEHAGARVFLDPAAAAELDDQVLDVHSHGDHVHFTFAPQNDA